MPFSAVVSPLKTAPELNRNLCRRLRFPVPCLRKPMTVDVWYPVLHGPNGEDGTVQGLFQIDAAAHSWAQPCSDLPSAWTNRR